MTPVTMPIAGIGKYDDATFQLERYKDFTRRPGEGKGWADIYLRGKEREQEFRIRQAEDDARNAALKNKGSGCGGGPKNGPGTSGDVTTSVVATVLLGLAFFVSRFTPAGLASSFIPFASVINNQQNEIL